MWKRKQTLRRTLLQSLTIQFHTEDFTFLTLSGMRVRQIMQCDFFVLLAFRILSEFMKHCSNVILAFKRPFIYSH